MFNLSIVIVALSLIPSLNNDNWRTRQQTQDNLTVLNNVFDLRTVFTMAEKFSNQEISRRCFLVNKNYYQIKFNGIIPPINTYNGIGNKEWSLLFNEIYYASYIFEMEIWMWKRDPTKTKKDEELVTIVFLNTLFDKGKSRVEVLDIIKTMRNNEYKRRFYEADFPENYIMKHGYRYLHLLFKNMAEIF